MADGDPAPAVNVDESPPTGTDEDGGRWTRLARAAGGSELGCTLEERRRERWPQFVVS